jgi:5-methylthioadenosine/S-adenosylhomocysteine deaminase
MVTRFDAHRERVRSHLSDRVRLGISPHSTYSASVELWEAAAATGLPLATHLAESEGEIEWVRRRTGPFADVIGPDLSPSSIGALAERGLLCDRLVAAHCVHLDDEELELLARHDVAVAHCPRSNAYLGCGIAPLAALRAAGLRVGLGTDSPASAPSFDLFDELRAAVAAARARERRSDALTGREALELATMGSARALGLDAEVGSLVPGKRADVTVVSLAESPYVPWEDPAAAVVFGGSPERVLLTVVDGEERYRRGESECRGLIDGARRARGRLLQHAATTART